MAGVKAEIEQGEVRKLPDVQHALSDESGCERDGSARADGAYGMHSVRIMCGRLSEWCNTIFIFCSCDEKMKIVLGVKEGVE
jgi:hypothetical protein